MKERPIIFSTEMIKAKLGIIKTHTRRVINSLLGFGRITEFQKSDTPGYDWCFRNSKKEWNEISHKQLLECCPYGKPGDLLYVREKFRLFNSWDECSHYDDYSCSRNNGMPVYYADTLDDENKWKPSIHMPKKYARIWLKIKNIRVERVQDIKTEDIIKEGLSTKMRGHDAIIDLERQWIELWNSINKKRGYGWDINPFVRVIEFEKYNYANNQ